MDKHTRGRNNAVKKTCGYPERNGAPLIVEIETAVKHVEIGHACGNGSLDAFFLGKLKRQHGYHADKLSVFIHVYKKPDRHFIRQQLANTPIFVLPV